MTLGHPLCYKDCEKLFSCAGNFKFNGTLFDFADMLFNLVQMKSDFGKGLFIDIEIKK